MAYLPTPNQSVSGTVGASLIGQTAPHSVLVLNPVSTLAVTGNLGSSVIGHAPVVIVGGSVAASFTPPANQSVSGEVSVSNFPTTQNVSGSVAAWLQSTNASIITVGGATGNSSVQVLNFPAIQDIAGSVATQQIGTRITSLVSTVPSSVIIGASIFGLPPVNVTNTNLNVGGSVVAFQSAGWSGSVATQQIGTRITSLVSTVPSSVIVGASIFGLAPVQVQNTNLNVGGSVVAFQGGTNITSISGGSVSVVGTVPVTQSGTWIPSVLNLTTRNDAVASFLGVDLTYRPQASDSAGRTLIKPFAAEESRVEGYHSVVSTSVTTLVAAAGAGLRNYITDFFIANTGATTTLITFKDGAGSILGYTIAPAGGGSNGQGLTTPIRTGANATFDFQPTAASSIIYATVKGFKAP